MSFNAVTMRSNVFAMCFNAFQYLFNMCERPPINGVPRVCQCFQWFQCFSPLLNSSMFVNAFQLNVCVVFLGVVNVVQNMFQRCFMQFTVFNGCSIFS